MEEDCQYLSMLSPGMPLPQCGPDFLPDVSWADPTWDLDTEIQLAEQLGKEASQSLSAPDDPVSPPSCWPRFAPTLFNATAESSALPVLDAAIFEDQAGAAPAAPPGPSHPFSSQGSDPSPTLFGPGNPSFASTDYKGGGVGGRTESTGRGKKSSGTTAPSWGKAKSKSEATKKGLQAIASSALSPASKQSQEADPTAALCKHQASEVSSRTAADVSAMFA